MVRDWLLKIASERNLRGEDLRVFLILLANAEKEEVRIAQTEIAKSLNLKQSRVSRAIKRLVALEIISKKLIAGKLVGYRFLIEEQSVGSMVDTR